MALGHGFALPRRYQHGGGRGISCAYPLNADATEIGLTGFAPLALSNGDQTCTYTIDGAPGSTIQALAFQSGALTETAGTLSLTSGKKVVQFATTMPTTVGGGASAQAYTVEHTLSTIEFVTIAQVKFALEADGDKEVTVYLDGSPVLSETVTSFPTLIDMRFDCDAQTAVVAFDGINQVLSSDSFAPAEAIVVVAISETTSSPSGDAGKEIEVTLRTSAGEITGTQPGGYTDACGNAFSDVAEEIYPTAFSATQRGGYAGAGFGVWADGGMRVVRHDATTAWLSIRTISGIASGSRVSCWATVTGTSSAIGIGLGNASVLLSNYAGANANGVTLFGDSADVYSGGASVETTTGTLAQNDRVRMDVDLVANTVRFYKQTGGTGPYVAMCDAVDVSGLYDYANIIYPVCSAKDANCVVTWDFGHGSETAPSGFTAGPVGPWGGWLLPHVELYFGADTTRMWEVDTQAGTAAPNVITTDPIGAWHGVNYARLIATAATAQRPEKNAGGVKVDSTGGNKTLEHNLSATIAQPTAFTVMARYDDVTRNPRFGFANASYAVINGNAAGTSTVQAATARNNVVNLAAAKDGSTRTIVVTSDGTTAWALDADGNWGAIAQGVSTDTITKILLAASASNVSIATVRVLQVSQTVVTETDARNWKYWAENNLEAATA